MLACVGRSKWWASRIEMVTVLEPGGKDLEENYYNSAFVLARDQMARAHCAASDLGEKKKLNVFGGGKHVTNLVRALPRKVYKPSFRRCVTLLPVFSLVLSSPY